MLSSVTPGNGTPSVLRTVLRPPSAPTSQAARTVSPVVSVAVTPSSSWVKPTSPTPNSTVDAEPGEPRRAGSPRCATGPASTGFGYGTSGVGSTIGNVRALPHELAVDVGAQRLGQLPRGEHGVEHAEVVEHLEGAGLRPSPREPVNGCRRLVDDADGDAAAGEVDRQGETGRARTGNEHWFT